MAEINLLPKELAPKKSVIELSKKIKKLLFAGLAFFIIAVIAISVSVYILRKNLRDLSVKQEDLITQIRALEQTEQKIVLIKDRLEKINQVLVQKSVLPELIKFEKIYDSNQAGIKYKKLAINADNTTLDLEIEDSKTLVSFMANITGNDLYKMVYMSSFEYNAQKEFELSFTMSN